jgi:hypothetical protein
VHSIGEGEHVGTALLMKVSIVRMRLQSSSRVDANSHGARSAAATTAAARYMQVASFILNGDWFEKKQVFERASITRESVSGHTCSWKAWRITLSLEAGLIYDLPSFVAVILSRSWPRVSHCVQLSVGFVHKVTMRDHALDHRT